MNLAPMFVMAVIITTLPQREAAPRRGAFAFHYGPVLDSQSLAWYSKFDILVTHDPLPPRQVRELKEAGTKLLLYEWSVAFYDSLATEWQRSLLPSRTAVLNERPLTGGVGSETAGAWYYDPADREHLLGRTEDLARRVEAAGYDGVFFDTTTLASVHPAAREEYQRRHPETSYDEAFSWFLGRLRWRLPRTLLFTNQGYRKAEHYLPYVDWDLNESLMTWKSDDGAGLRPWNDTKNPWNGIHFVMTKMIEPMSKRYPSVRFASLNYVDSKDPEVTRVVVATAQIFGGEGYVAAATPADEADRIYFRDPGKPAGPRFDNHDRSASWRFFENGLVVVTSSSQELRIDVGRKSLRNHITRELICGGDVILPPSPDRARAYFFNYTGDCAYQ